MSQSEAYAGAVYKQIDPEWLRRQYQDEGLTPAKIAAQLDGVEVHHINYALERHHIQRRGKGHPRKYDLDPAWLRRKYHDEGLTQQQIADLAGVGVHIIGTAMRRHGIATRSPGERHQHARPSPHHDPAWLRRKYYDEGLTQQQIADRCGVHLQTIIQAMRKHHMNGRRGRSPRTPSPYPPPDPVCNPHVCPYWGDCLDWPVDAPCRELEDRGEV